MELAPSLETLRHTLRDTVTQGFEALQCLRKVSRDAELTRYASIAMAASTSSCQQDEAWHI